MILENYSLVKRIIKYSNERFPIILCLTTASVVFSSFVISTGKLVPEINTNFVVGFVTGLLYLFHIRLFDELKDFEHDSKYYPKRPVIRGLLSLNEIKNIAIVAILFEFIANLFVPTKVFLFFLILFAYSAVCRYEFFISDLLRRNFFVYNILHYFQMSLVVVYLYILAGVDLRHLDKLLILHFIFTNLTFTLIEWARKMRIISEENESKDTYSARLGIRGVSLVFLIMAASTFICFGFIKAMVGSFGHSMFLSILGFILVITATLLYAIKRTKLSTNALQISSIIFFVLLHFSV
ncbi:MAG: UbiA family prenyltransferase [Minisyncoccia bacterium]|jgi:4-hydroxybenzoate polyprenyltransferase